MVEWLASSGLISPQGLASTFPSGTINRKIHPFNSLGLAMSEYAVLVVVQYSYDVDNTYYEVFRVECESHSAAISRVRGWLATAGFCQQRRILSSSVKRAVIDDSLDVFVGMRVGQFIERAMAKKVGGE